jgi:hypothetical protein
MSKESSDLAGAMFATPSFQQAYIRDFAQYLADAAQESFESLVIYFIIFNGQVRNLLNSIIC